MIVVALIVLVGFTASIGLWSNTMSTETDRITAEFQQRAQTRAHITREHIAIYPEIMQNLSTIASFNHPIFRAILDVSFGQLIARHPSISILEWVPHIKNEDRAAFEHRVSTQLSQPFAIRQRQPDNTFIVAPEADYYYPIQLAVPTLGNESIIGYDIRSAPTAPRLNLARESGRLVATPQFTIAQASGPEDKPAVVLIMPVFSINDQTGNTEFRGFVQCILQIHSSLAQIHQNGTDEALLIYYDDASATGEERRIMYANLAGVEPVINNSTSVPPPLEANATTPDVVIEDLAVGGRDWRFIAVMNPQWAAAQRTAIPALLLAGGILGTLLLALLVNTMLVRNREIEATVERRTADVVRARQLLEKDITRRVVVEKSLRENETLLRGLLDNSTSAIFIKDLRGRYTLFNQQYQNMLGRSAQEIFGQTDHDLFSAELVKLFTEKDREIIETGVPKKYEFQQDVRGTSHTDLVQKFPLLDTAGKVYAICGIVTDISYRAAAEAERQQLQRQSESSQRLESLGVLAGGIAHDFNNILTTILGHASLIRKQGGNVLAHTDQLTKIETAVRRASELCEQMLTYAGQKVHRLTLVDFNAIIRDTIVLLSSSLPKNIQLPLQLNPQLHAVKADTTQLRQIVMNLVINAADALGDKPGTITLQTFEQDFTATELGAAAGSPALTPGPYTVFRVSDTGPGIDPATLPRIFEPFYTTKFHGRGLGLSTVLGIVQNHEGGLVVESSPEKGTTFSILLPFTNQPPPLPAATPASATETTFSGCALVVDDEDSVREVTVAALEMSHLVVHEASSGAEAIELYRQLHTQIDIVLLDMTMPGLSGSETLVALQQIDPDVQAVILSGYSQKEARERLGDLRIAAFLQKPFELDKLLHTLGTLKFKA